MYVMFTCMSLSLGMPARPSAAHPSCAGPKRRKTAPQSGCPHYKPDRVEDLSGLALAEVQDIEQLVSKGRGLGACPYYSSRRALRMAEVHMYVGRTVALNVHSSNNVLLLGHRLAVSSLHTYCFGNGSSPCGVFTAYVLFW